MVEGFEQQRPGCPPLDCVALDLVQTGISPRVAETHLAHVYEEPPPSGEVEDVVGFVTLKHLQRLDRERENR